MSQKINDHSFWAGGKSADSVFPKGVHTKSMNSAEGAGAENDYEDTSEKIQRQQEMGVSKAKGRQMKAGYRN